MSSFDPRSYALIVLLAASSASGCGLLVGAGDFVMVEPDAGVPVGPWDGALDWLPAACGECATLACKDEIDLCVDDPVCAALMHCIVEAKDPGEMAVCGTRHAGAELLFGFAANCMVSTCSTPCSTGRRWECSEQVYEWPPPAQPSFDFTARFTDVLSAAPLKGLTVKACRREGWMNPSCDPPQKSGETDALGFVLLEDIPFRILTTDAPWTGWLDVSGPDLYPEIRTWTWPALSDRSDTLSSLTNDTVATLGKTYGFEQQADRAIVTADVFDCFGFRAPGVTVELDSADASTGRVYSRGDGTFDKDATETGGDGIVGFSNVPKGITTLRVRLPSGEQVACTEILVRAGSRTGVGVRPSPGGACK